MALGAPAGAVEFLRARRARTEHVLRRIIFICICALALTSSTLLAAADISAAAILSLYEKGNVAEADGRLAALLEQTPAASQRCELFLAAASADRAAWDAKRRLRATIETCGGTDQAAQAWARLIKLLHAGSEDRAAMSACDEFLDQYPDNKDAAEILLLKGALELRLPPGATSGRAFAQFLARFPDDPRAAQALAGLGDIKIRERDWDGAAQAYLRALQANPNILDVPSIYFHLGLAAENQGNKDMARHYYQQLQENWTDTMVAARAKDRLDSTLSIGRDLRAGGESTLGGERYGVAVGFFASLAEGEVASSRFTAAGMRVHLILRGKRCELLVGEFESEHAAKLFAPELAKRFSVQAVVKRLP
jgi:tetratricopeptide (TPR) repeat protein